MPDPSGAVCARFIEARKMPARLNELDLDQSTTWTRARGGRSAYNVYSKPLLDRGTCWCAAAEGDEASPIRGAKRAAAVGAPNSAAPCWYGGHRRRRLFFFLLQTGWAICTGCVGPLPDGTVTDVRLQYFTHGADLYGVSCYLLSGMACSSLRERRPFAVRVRVAWR